MRKEQTNATPEDTEVWQPVPEKVSPGAQCAGPPSNALILFDGRNKDHWVSAKDGNHSADWDVHDGVLTVNKKAGNIETRGKRTARTV